VIDPEAAVQLQLLGFQPPPASVPDAARREEIRRQVAQRIRFRRRAARLVASRCWWIPTGRPR
jgi:hypothetical protein